MTADPKSLPERLRSWWPPAGVTLEREDYDLFIEAATALEAQAALLEEARGLMVEVADAMAHEVNNGDSGSGSFLARLTDLRNFIAKTEPT